METTATNLRSQRGLTLARTRGEAIKPIVAAKYLVPSASHSGGYVVDVAEGTCTCPDYTSLGRDGTAHRCKHLWATLYVRREIPLPNGDSVVVEQAVRINYPRDWHATNAARTEIPRLGPSLLADLIHNLPIHEKPAGGRGRRPVPVRDVLLAAALRVFEDSTAGAAVVAAENYRSLGLIHMDHVPSYNTLLREIAKPSYMPLLHQLVATSALPMLAFERGFAIDGTGFGTSNYDCWFDKKHGDPTKQRAATPKHRWVQGTIVFGVTTHVIAAVQITESNVAECPLMPELLRRTIANGGNVVEWYADKAYMAAYNIEAIEAAGAMPYIAFPDRVTGARSPIVRRLYEKMRADRQDYDDHYHRRSLAESGMAQIKTRFSPRLRSRVPKAQYAEATLRCTAHNVACLVQCVEELKIDPKYWAPSIPSLASVR